MDRAEFCNNSIKVSVMLVFCDFLSDDWCFTCKNCFSFTFPCSDNMFHRPHSTAKMCRVCSDQVCHLPPCRRSCSIAPQSTTGQRAKPEMEDKKSFPRHRRTSSPVLKIFSCPMPSGRSLISNTYHKIPGFPVRSFGLVPWRKQQN